MIPGYFVCVGAQKAGTTWLLASLGKHPAIFTTPVKEIHYFDHVRGVTSHLADGRRRSRLRTYLQRLAFDWRRRDEHRSQWGWYRAYMRSPIDDGWYASLFRHRGDATIAGEATPEYAILGREGFEHIKQLAPTARVIFVMRNPVDQAWSQFLHFEHKPDRRGVRGRGPIDFWESAYSTPFRDYATTIDDLVAVFGSDRVRCLFYEDIHADRQAAMRALCSFLDVEYEPRCFGDLGEPHNVSRRVPIPAELRSFLVERHRRVAEEVLERLGAIPRAWRESLLMPPAPADPPRELDAGSRRIVTSGVSVDSRAVK